MRPAVLLIALGIGAMVVGFKAAPDSALSCAKGSVRATIDGKQTCLKAGKRCSKRLDRQYHRYKFHCHTGRLTRAVRAKPLTPLTIALDPVNGSGVSGTATLEPAGAGHTKVTLEISNPPPGDLPAHIHVETCRFPNTIRFGLSNVVNGRSVSTLDKPIPYLRISQFAIMVHKAEPALPVIACGQIPLG